MTARSQRVEVELPLPDGRIGPNGREGWRNKSKLVREHREWAYTATRAAMWPLGPEAVYWPAARLDIEWRFAGTQPDQDNCWARMKCYLDGAIDAGIVANDRSVTIGTIALTRVTRPLQGVVITFTRIES